jgi:hypothetical protein
VNKQDSGHIRAQQHDYAPDTIHARRLPPDGTSNTTGEAEPTLGRKSPPRPTLSLASGAISISPAAEFGLGVISPPCPSLPSATFSTANHAGGHSADCGTR